MQTQMEINDILHKRLLETRKMLDDILLADDVELAKLRTDAAVRVIKQGLREGLKGFVGQPNRPMQGLAAQIGADETFEVVLDPSAPAEGTGDLFEDIDCCGNGCPIHEDEEIL